MYTTHIHAQKQMVKKKRREAAIAISTTIKFRPLTHLYLFHIFMLFRFFIVICDYLCMEWRMNELSEMRWGPLLCIILYACLSVKDNFVVVNRSQFVSFIFLFTSIISALIPHLTLNTNVYIPLHQQYQKRVLHRSIHSSLAFFHWCVFNMRALLKLREVNK